jgi:aminopeptidase N
MYQRFYFLLFFLPVFALASPVRPPENNLTEVFAKTRRKQVESLSYDLRLNFMKGKDSFSGKVKLFFKLHHLNMPLSIDWLGEKIDSLQVNGEPLKTYRSAKGWLEIPAAKLRKNQSNTVEIDFTTKFSTEGNGIQRVVDSEDQAEYLYTDFEPYHAHELFPCLDQPDLKAALNLEVSAPSDWLVIANELIESQDKVSKPGSTITKFQTTKPLPTYLYFVGAGPFVEWKDQEGSLPIVIYARKSLAKYLDVANVMETTKKGLRFFSEYFGYPYPFSKYGMIFVPEFGWGGMENPGAVTLNEQNIYRGPVPKSRRESRDSLILHEMAHMWFGDLVTMHWWNDLWLNESFATYLATVAQDRALSSASAWLSFASSKGWGYWQDQLITTHPIETPVPDVRTGKGNFDGITYAKGAAAIQQLHSYVGEDAFRSGLRAYFNAFAFSNAKRSDFVNAIGNAAEKDLSSWTRSWLQTSGPNRVKVIWACREKKLSRLEIEQKPSSSGNLSPHRTRVGLFQRHGKELEFTISVDAPYEGKLTKLKVPDTECPDFVYPNLDDKDYALFSLDEISLQRASSVLNGGVKDPLLRLQVWNTLYQMVRDSQFSPMEYINLAIQALEKESDDSVLGVLLGRYSHIRSVWEQYLSVADRKNLAARIETVLWGHVTGEVAGSSRQMSFFDFYVRMAQSEQALNSMAEMISNSGGISLTSSGPLPPGIQLDQDRRWAILLTLARRGYQKALTLAGEELKRDGSNSGKRAFYSIGVAVPEEAAKLSFWQSILTPENIPPNTLSAGAAEFHQPDHLGLSEKFTAAYFKRLQSLDFAKSDHLLDVYFDGLFPHSLCSKKLLNLSKESLRAAKKLTPLARRYWLEANDELSRCVKIGRR